MATSAIKYCTISYKTKDAYHLTLEKFKNSLHLPIMNRPISRLKSRHTIWEQKTSVSSLEDIW